MVTAKKSLENDSPNATVLATANWPSLAKLKTNSQSTHPSPKAPSMTQPIAERVVAVVAPEDFAPEDLTSIALIDAASAAIAQEDSVATTKSKTAGKVSAATLNTRKPIPLVATVERKKCPVCGTSSYSLSGEHPQCAQNRADKVRRAVEKANAPEVAPEPVRPQPGSTWARWNDRDQE